MGSGFTNSDLAFKGMHAVVGNYHGFNTYDIENARRPRLVASIVCPGGQGDVSIYGNLLFMSVEQTRGRLDCGVQGVTAPVSAERFRGIRIFDISDLKKPQAGGGDADLPRLAHAHAGPGQERPRHALRLRFGHEHGALGRGAGRLLGPEAEEDPNTALFSIDVIKVPLEDPREGGHRQPAAHLRRPDDRRHLGPVAGRRPRPGHADARG